MLILGQFIKLLVTANYLHLLSPLPPSLAWLHTCTSQLPCCRRFYRRSFNPLPPCLRNQLRQRICRLKKWTRPCLCHIVPLVTCQMIPCCPLQAIYGVWTVKSRKLCLALLYPTAKT